MNMGHPRWEFIKDFKKKERKHALDQEKEKENKISTKLSSKK